MAQTQHWQHEEVRTHDSIEASLNYLAPTEQRPVYYARALAESERRNGLAPEPHRVRIRDARRLSEAPTLDRNGFQLVAHRSRVTSFSDRALIENEYYAEAIQVIRQVTGAEHVVIFDHTLRSAEASEREATSIREPGNRVHNDQTFVSGPRRVRDHLPPEEAEARLRKRHGIINFWRPIGNPVENWPLALCDARSIKPSDLVPTDLVYPDKVGETYSFRYNPDHRWLYYPKLTPDEVLLLKIFDSRTDGTARLTAHTAFDIRRRVRARLRAAASSYALSSSGTRQSRERCSRRDRGRLDRRRGCQRSDVSEPPYSMPRAPTARHRSS